MIFIVKVTTNKEERVMQIIAEHILKKEIEAYALARPQGLKGYIILEAIDRDSAEDASFNLPYVKGIMPKTISYDEIKNMLEQTIESINVEEGDIVEILTDPFKKEKAKVTRIDKQKGELVVSLLGAVVKIPVTIKIDNVKVIRRTTEQSEDEEDEE